VGGPAGGAVARGVVSDQAGRVWLATAHDVRAFDGVHWQVYDRTALRLQDAADSEATTRFTLHVAPRDGAVWVAACNFIPAGPAATGGVRWFDGTTWQGAGSPLDKGCGGAITSNAAGAVWLGLDDRLMGLDPDTNEWTIFDAPAPPEGQHFGYVADLVLDPLERPWPLLMLCGGARCEAGQVRFLVNADGTWTQVGTASAAPQRLFFDIAGSGWLLSQEGVQRATDGQVQSAGDVQVLVAAADASGQIYVVGEQAGELALWLIRPGSE
jgi:hypothetical protein